MTGADAESPGWLKPGAVFAFRGGTEKVLRIGATTIETIDADRFATWSTEQFMQAAAAGEIVHQADGRMVRRPTKPALSPIDQTASGAEQSFLSLCSEIGGGDIGAARRGIFKWARAIRSGGDVEPWQHVMGLALIDLGAEYFGHGAKVAFPTGKGRRSKHFADAAKTQHLIRRFDRFIGGGEPVSSQEWGWLRHLLDIGMAEVGLMPLPKRRLPGRPTSQFSAARRIDRKAQMGLLTEGRGGLARAIRDAARGEILRELQVRAAWRDQDHTQLSVAEDDPDVEERAKVIQANYHIARRRAAANR